MQRSDIVKPSEVQVTQVQQARAGVAARSAVGPRPFLYGLAALIALLAVLLIAYNITHSDRIFRGVSVHGTDLGGMNRAEALAALTSATAGYPAEPLVISAGDKTWTFAPADLGSAVDVEKTLDAALSLGHGTDMMNNLGTQLGTLANGRKVTPVLLYDGAKVESAVASVAAEVDKPAIDSTLDRHADGTVIITPSTVGSVLDQKAVVAAVSGSLASVPFAPVQVKMMDQQPAVTEAALESTRAEAMLLTEQNVNLTADGETWALTPAELRQMLALESLGGEKWAVSLDGSALATFLDPVAESLYVEPIDAAVTIGKGTVTLREEKSGRFLDIPAAVEAIKRGATGTDEASRTVELPLKVSAAELHTEQVKPLYDKAEALVTQGIRMHFADDGYTIRGAAITSFIDVERAQGGPGPFQLVVDEEVLATRVKGVAYYINRSAADARFRMVNGAPAKIGEAKDGYKVNVDGSVQNALKAIDAYTGGDKLQVQLDVTVTEAAIKDADLSTIHTPDVLGTGQTSYAGSSAERAHNVGLGTQRVDGALIPPGGIFSTVDTIGDLTLDAGFKMGYGIIRGPNGVTTVPAEAGGICQVSTTLFHSAFWAGLPMVERNWHSYWIGTYGRAPSGLPGLDATIAPPEKDFRFKNSTNNWILIRATADGKTVDFTLYGVNPGWKVNVGKPVITNVVKTSHEPVTEYSAALPAGKRVLVEHAQDGFDASISRTVLDASGNVIDQWTAKSHYVPARERYLIGTGK